MTTIPSYYVLMLYQHYHPYFTPLCTGYYHVRRRKSINKTPTDDPTSSLHAVGCAPSRITTQTAAAAMPFAPATGQDSISCLRRPTRTRGARSMRLSAVVGMRSTVSRCMVCVVQSYEHATARCIPPSAPHTSTHVGGRAARNNVISMLYVSTRVKIWRFVGAHLLAAALVCALWDLVQG